jgi:threonyl-tRNA synthetase
MTYVDADGEKKFPIIIHRSSIGCYERTLALLIEKYAGAFPLWLAPTQVKILPIADRHNSFCDEIADGLRKCGIRVELDSRSEKIGFKIREAQLSKVPYMLVIGDNEVENKQATVRSRKTGESQTMPVEQLCEILQGEIARKEL